MKSRIKNTVVFLSLIIVLLIIGMVWRNHEISNIRNTNYDKNMRQVMHITSATPAGEMSDLKKAIKEEHMHIIEENESRNYFWEMVGQTNRFWILSSSVHKTIIIADPTSRLNDKGETIWLIQIFDRRIRSGSMLYFSIVILSLMTAVVFMTNKEWLPHIFTANPQQTPGETRQ